MMGNNMFGASAHEYVWIVCDDEQGDLHYYVGQHGEASSETKPIKKQACVYGERKKGKKKKEKNEGEWTGKIALRTKKEFPVVGLVKAVFTLIIVI